MISGLSMKGRVTYQKMQHKANETFAFRIRKSLRFRSIIEYLLRRESSEI